MEYTYRNLEGILRLQASTPCYCTEYCRQLEHNGKYKVGQKQVYSCEYVKQFIIIIITIIY